MTQAAKASKSFSVVLQTGDLESGIFARSSYFRS